MHKEVIMVKTESNGGSVVGCPEGADLTAMTTAALKAAVLTNGRYGMNYLVQLLIGEVGIQYRKPEHGSLETNGSWNGMSRTRARELMCYLIRKGLLYQSMQEYPLIRISKMGREFLEKPYEINQGEEQIFPGKPEVRLRYKLMELREQIAQENNLPASAIFPETTLQHLCVAKPGSELELLQVYGIGPWKAKKYGSRILEVMESFRENEKVRAVTRVLKSVVRPTFQETKTLFQQGLDSGEIARTKGIKESTVRHYLEKLHLCGEIDLRTWIEKQVDRNTLHRAIRYFREAEDKRLSTAHEVLGLDYETLRLCRIYLQPPAALKQIIAA